MDNKHHIVHTESSGGWGGQEIRILSEIQEFMRNKHPITLICDIDSPIAKRAKEYQIHTIELPIGKKNIKGLLALKKWFSSNNFDIVNTHSSSDSWMAALGMRLARCKKPLIRTRHVSAPVSNNLATRWLYHKAANHIVTTGEKLRETLIRENNLNPEKVTSVPTGIDTSLFVPTNEKSTIRKKLNIPEEKTVISIVATLRSWKGHSYLIQAFHKLANKDTHLLIVGDGPQWENINEQIQSYNLEKMVTLCGDQKNVIPWLQATDIFVLPSYANEGVPQGIMQAMSCGLPVISTNVGSITEIIKHKETGLIVPSKNADAICKSIELLINDHHIKNILKSNAKTLSLKKFNVDIMYQKMNAIFKKVVND
ncbi:glycosyltransferase family 4 protein [Eionea flava]